MKTVQGIAGILLAMELVYLAASAAWLITGNAFALNNAAFAPAGGRYLLATDALGGLLLLLAVTGAGITSPILRGFHGAGTKWASIAMAAVSLLVALVIVGDARLLTVLGYLPLLLLIAIGAAPGALPSAEQFALADLAHQLLLFLLAGTWTILALRLSHQTPAAAHQKTAGRLSRFFFKHRVAVTVVAAAIPAVYAVTRFAWAAGIPLGINAGNAEQLLASGGATAALGLACMAAAGVLLTLGLIQRWGRQWPRWVPRIGGKPVPVGLAVVPAGLVAVILVPAGTDMFRLALAAPADNGIPPFSWDNWAILGPNLLWHGWAVALAAAAYGYWLMRREQESYKKPGRTNVTDRTNWQRMALVIIPMRGPVSPNAWRSRVRRLLRHTTHLVIGGVVAIPVGGVLVWVVQLMLLPQIGWYGILPVLVIGAAALFLPPMLTVTQGMQRIAAVELLEARIAASVDKTWPSRFKGALWYYYSILSGLLFVTGLVFCLPTLVSTPLLLMTGQRAGLDELLGQLAPGTPEATSLPWLLGLCAAVLAASFALGAALRPTAEALLGPSQRQLRLDAERRSRELARRNELARELHDSVGHALTVTTLQASAARRMLIPDPEAADEAMAAVELAGRTALAELDEVLGILRSPSGLPQSGTSGTSDTGQSGEAALATQGLTLESLGHLLDRSRSAGLEVSASIPESTTAVPPVVARAVYRIIQEGLTNAMKYAADSSCSVRLEVHGNRSKGTAHIIIGNSIPGSGRPLRAGGKGLSGLKERAAVLGGTLEAREAGGRWLLDARLPWGKEGTP